MNASQKKQVLVITPHIKGGPWQWGADLANELNKIEEFQARHIFKLKDKFLSPFSFNSRIFHTTNPLAFSFLVRSFILTVHGKIHGGFWKFFYWLGIKRISVVTVPSQFLKNYLGIKKAIVIPNAINVANFSEVNLVDHDYFNILTITKFWFPEKTRGLFELAQLIFNLAKDFDKRINWRIVGYGPLLEDVKKSITLLERPKNVSVQWFGYDTPQKYFSDSDIFAYFSYEDNMPIALMEAMASGLPVITNKVGAVGEIIKSGSDGFVAKNNQDYQNIFLSLMNDFSLRKKIGGAARKKIEEKFSWKAILPKWLELYKKIT